MFDFAWSEIALIGVVEAGLWTMVFPAAMAGPILWSERLSGKLKGVIAAMTPRGSRMSRPVLPLPPVFLPTRMRYVTLAPSHRNGGDK